MTLDEVLAVATNYCKKLYPEEACGFILKTGDEFSFSPQENITVNDKKTNFTISTNALSQVFEEGTLYALLHSHTTYLTDFSTTDRTFQAKMGIPWVLIDITSPKRPNVKWLTREKEVLPLYGRKFLFGVYDCFTFVRDWYKEEFDIELNDYQRVDNFAKRGFEPYLDNYKREGFLEVPFNMLSYGDVLLLKLDDNAVSHAAVYVGDNLIAHHLTGRLSKKDFLGSYYKDRLVKVVRHKLKMGSAQDDNTAL